MVKNPPANVGDLRDLSWIPGSGRSPGGGHGNPFQYSCLENLMEKKKFPKHTSHSASASQPHVTAMGTMEKERPHHFTNSIRQHRSSCINMFLGSCVLHYLVILLIATIFTCTFFNIILLNMQMTPPL